MPFTSKEFHDLLDPDLWVIEQMLTLPSDPEPIINERDGKAHVEITDTVAIPQMQEAVAEYRRRILPVIFIASQKVYAELFRFILAQHGVSAGNRQSDVEQALRSRLLAAGITTVHPFSDAADFHSWWSSKYSYTALRLARNRIAHHSYSIAAARLTVTDDHGHRLLDWTESDVLTFGSEVVRLSKQV